MSPILIKCSWRSIATAILFVVSLFGSSPIIAQLPAVLNPDDEQFLADIHDAGIVAPDGQAIQVAHQVVDSAYRTTTEFGVYDYHVPAFVQAAMNAYGQGVVSSGPSLDRQFLADIHDAGIVAPDGQAIQVAHQVVDSTYRTTTEFGVYDYHVPAFVQAAMNAYAPNTTSSSSSSGEVDEQFLSKIRAAGFPEAQMSDRDAIHSAHKIVDWLCSDVPSIRNTVEGYLAENYRITEREGPGGSRAFTEAALESYRGVSSGADC
ncbi:hypothetical protein B0I32_13955 [Nonomuraea fuscirosea]|uniref:Uncharacterized protein n=1 Tax=Nonomuraea fuscirosea TaxID=1291556 RepID=A0A2T0LY31_9ACTN|nr:DUF732 domain-containing protein [Nonomuraea fuscirosea]PRX48962.1 hypothetical protein B0I32_13955 [Nonomuraea fuscirosea]